MQEGKNEGERERERERERRGVNSARDMTLQATIARKREKEKEGKRRVKTVERLKCASSEEI